MWSFIGIGFLFIGLLIYLTYLIRGLTAIRLMLKTIRGNPNLSKLILTEGITEKVLEEIAMNGNLKMIRVLLGDSSRRDYYSRELMLNSIISGEEDFIVEIIQSGYDVQQNDNEHIITAATSGNIDILKLLIEAGGNPKARNEFALCRAVKNENIPMTKFLLKECHLNPTINNHCCFWQAIRDGNFELYQLLYQWAEDISDEEINQHLKWCMEKSSSMRIIGFIRDNHYHVDMNEVLDGY